MKTYTFQEINDKWSLSMNKNVKSFARITRAYQPHSIEVKLYSGESFAFYKVSDSEDKYIRDRIDLLDGMPDD